jgi:hypothetical protein
MEERTEVVDDGSDRAEERTLSRGKVYSTVKPIRFNLVHPSSSENMS